MKHRYEYRCGTWANDMGDDGIDMVISHIDMGYLVTLEWRPPPVMTLSSSSRPTSSNWSKHAKSSSERELGLDGISSARTALAVVGVRSPRGVALGSMPLKQGLTLVHFSAQPKPCWSHLSLSTCLIDWGKIMHPTYPTKCAYMLSRIVDECKSLPGGRDSNCEPCGACPAGATLQRRKLNSKAKVDSGSLHFSFKRLDPGAFNAGLMGSTCTASPRGHLLGLALDVQVVVEGAPHEPPRRCHLLGRRVDEYSRLQLGGGAHEARSEVDHAADH